MKELMNSFPKNVSSR